MRVIPDKDPYNALDTAPPLSNRWMILEVYVYPAPNVAHILDWYWVEVGLDQCAVRIPMQQEQPQA